MTAHPRTQVLSRSKLPPEWRRLNPSFPPYAVPRGFEGLPSEGEEEGEEGRG